MVAKNYLLITNRKTLDSHFINKILKLMPNSIKYTYTYILLCPSSPLNRTTAYGIIMTMTYKLIQII